MALNSSPATAALSIRAVGGALMITLVALYLVCWLVAVIAPNVSASHAWLALFGAAAPVSLLGLGEGLLSNIAMAWLAAAVYVPTHNRLARR